MNNITNFLRDVKVEMYRVSWPTRQQTINYTIAVIVVSIAFAVLLGAIDAVFSFGLQQII